jgi:hypothetical protein
MCQGRAFIVEVLFPMTIARCAVLAASLAAYMYWLWVRVFVRFSGSVGQHLVMGRLGFFFLFVARSAHASPCI